MSPFADVTPKDLQVLQGYSYATALRQHRIIRDAIGLDRVMFYHLAKYWNTSVEELYEALRPVRKK